MDGLNLKSEQVYRYLRIYIDQNKFSMSNRLPSEHFLCNRLSVCRETVRQAVSLLVEEGLACSRRGSGTFFDKAKAIASDYAEDLSRLQIALIIQGQDHEANASFIQSIRTTLKADNVELRVFFTDNKVANERKCLESCMMGIHGLIVDGVKASLMNPNLDCYARLYEKGIPFVFYNNYYSGTSYPKVIMDDESCADNLIQELVSKGHTHIGGLFLCDNYQGCKKYLGCAKAMIRQGARFDDSYMKWLLSDELDDWEQVKRTIYRFLRSIPECTAIVCCNIMLYQALKEVLLNEDKKIPDDYSVVCFDYSKPDWNEIGLTCSVHPGEEVGRVSARMLMKMVYDPCYKNKEKEFSYMFPPQIHIGTSVRQIQNNLAK